LKKGQGKDGERAENQGRLGEKSREFNFFGKYLYFRNFSFRFR